MSYDLQLNHPVTKEVLEFPEAHFLRGGTYALHGTTRATLNVTYNYAPFFYEHFPLRHGHTEAEGLRRLYGETAESSVPMLEEVAAKLDGEPTDNYWDAAPGNARMAVFNLLELARMAVSQGFGQAVWEGD